MSTTKVKIECREAPDYEPKYRAQPRWIVLVHRDGRLCASKTFNGENPKRDAQAYAKALRTANRKGR